MSEEKLYAVENDKSEFAHIDMDELTWETGFATLWFGVNEPYAKRTASDYGGHVVELVEAPSKVVVSEEEAEMLKRLRANEDMSPAGGIRNYFWGSAEGQNVDHKPRWSRENEFRLMRAYVNGWTVEKPKRYILPMEGTELADGTVAYAVLDHTGVWTVKGYAEEQSAITFGSTVTQANIDSAPAWVKAITPVEVTDDGN